jgi:transcriptional regulator
LKEQNVVPTWNYVAVHATGKVKLIEEPSELLDIIRRYVEVYESSMPESWQLDSAEPDFIESLLGAIVGFTIEIDSLEGKRSSTRTTAKNAVRNSSTG